MPRTTPGNRVGAFLLPICALFILQIGYAQRYNFQQYHLKDGLPQSQVSTIHQGPRGYLWLGQLAGGISQFDGVNFTPHNYTGTLQGMGAVYGSAHDALGNLWLHTTNGLYRYDGQEFIPYGPEKGFLLTAGPGSLVPMSDNRLAIIHSAPGILMYIDAEADSVIIDSLPAEYAAVGVPDVHQCADGRVLLGTTAGHLLVWSQGQFSDSDRPAPGLSAILDVHEDRQGNIWATGPEGIFVAEENGWRNLLADYPHLPQQSVLGCVEQRSGALWFSALSGAYRYYEGELEHMATYEGLTDNQIFGLCVDREDNVWFGTYGEGVFKFSGDRFQYLTQREGLPGDLIMGINQMDGEYYFPDFGTGIMRFDPATKRVTLYNAENTGLPSNLLLRSYVDQQGHLIFGYRIGGFSRFDGQRWQHHDYPPNAVASLAVAFAEDPAGNLWIGDLGKGLYKYDGRNFTRYTTAEGLPSNIIRSLYWHPEDEVLWVGTANGMVQWDGDTFSPLPFSDSVKNFVSWSIRRGPDDRVYMALLRGGVGSWDGEQFRHYTTDDGLASNLTYQISWDAEGNLYAGTEQGLDRITLNEAGRLVRLRHYGYQDGFLGIETNGHAAHRDEEGRMWIGTVSGVMILDPAHDKLNTTAPQVLLQGVQLDHAPLDWAEMGYAVDPWLQLPTETPVLNHQQNNLTFSYVGISLESPSSVTYSYRLVGHEERWAPIVNSRQVTYTNLAPGKYTFQLLARNKDGFANEKPLEFSFVIRPPFWQTTWFLVLASLGALGLVIGVVRLRTRSLRHAKEVLENKVQERTEEILAQKEEIEAQRDMIEQKNRDITDSLHYAQRIQTSILPLQHKIREGFPDHFILYHPRDIVSGDFYWHASQGERHYLAAVDCTGHGVPGAFMSLIASQILNQLVLDEKIEDLGELLGQLNERVQAALHQKGANSNSRDGLDIAIISHLPGTREVQFAGAKRPLYVVREGNMEVIKGDKLFIGGGHHRWSGGNFVTHTLPLEGTTQMYLTSDGYADQFGGPAGRKYMTRKFKQQLQDIAHRPMPEQKQALDEDLEAWSTGYSQTDDILVIGVRFSVE